MIDSNVNLLEETQNRRVQLQDLLDRAEDQQQTLDAQLADMDGHRAKAINAVEDGNSVLQDATRTLETLNGKSHQTHIRFYQISFFNIFFSPKNKSSVVNKTHINIGQKFELSNYGVESLHFSYEYIIK